MLKKRRCLKNYNESQNHKKHIMNPQSPTWRLRIFLYKNNDERSGNNDVFLWRISGDFDSFSNIRHGIKLI